MAPLPNFFARLGEMLYMINIRLEMSVHVEEFLGGHRLHPNAIKLRIVQKRVFRIISHDNCILWIYLCGGNGTRTSFKQRL